MSTKNITPKVHLFTELDNFNDDTVVMLMKPDGEKHRASLGELKAFILDSVNEEIIKLKEELKNVKVTKEAILEAFREEGSVALGKPFNIKSSKGIEEGGRSGDLYSTDKQVRVKVGKTWKTIITE